MAQIEEPRLTILVCTKNIDSYLTDFRLGIRAATAHQRRQADQSFILNLEVDETLRASVDAVIQIGSSMNLTVIGEGVERKTQRQIPFDPECQYGRCELFTPITSLSQDSEGGRNTMPDLTGDEPVEMHRTSRLCSQ